MLVYIQFNTECFTHRDAVRTYNRYGKGSGCKNGRGGPWRNNVYEVVKTCKYMYNSTLNVSLIVMLSERTTGMAREVAVRMDEVDPGGITFMKL